jgi:hypothetical protein
MCKIQSVKI